MGIRESLNKNPTVVTAATALIIVVAVVFIILQLAGGGGGSQTTGTPEQAWYTVDDGETWFADDAKKIPPFQHEGKEAVRIYLYTCDNGKTPFPGLLERFTPAGKKKQEELLARIESGQPGAEMAFIEDSAYNEKEVKKPRSPNARWIRIDRVPAEMMQVTCPDGSLENLQLYLPGM